MGEWVGGWLVYLGELAVPVLESGEGSNNEEWTLHVVFLKEAVDEGGGLNRLSQPLFGGWVGGLDRGERGGLNELL